MLYLYIIIKALSDYCGKERVRKKCFPFLKKSPFIHYPGLRNKSLQDKAQIPRQDFKGPL